MHLRRTLSRNRHVRPIKHRFFRRQVVINDFEDHVEFTNNNLALVLLVSEEGEALADAHALDISELAHHLA